LLLGLWDYIRECKIWRGFSDGLVWLIFAMGKGVIAIYYQRIHEDIHHRGFLRSSTRDDLQRIISSREQGFQDDTWDTSQHTTSQPRHADVRDAVKCIKEIQAYQEERNSNSCVS